MGKLRSPVLETRPDVVIFEPCTGNTSPCVVYHSFLPGTLKPLSSTCTSIPRANGDPGAGRPSPQTKTPALPPAFMCRHSSSRMKFSYCFSVRSRPVGKPVDTIRPSRTLNVPGATSSGTQPERSWPLNSDTHGSSAP